MPIQILSPQLANQIAAGEVVERPASVVKEIVENSLDAGATVIHIDIENGGASLIRIRDNGIGITKEELPLALARHATSKISNLDDLEHILSLGFRGEALASISSVSRLTLTSRTADQQEAWQVYAEGREMKAIITPASHPVGTTVEVANLFFNTPARRKFLRTDKTEFMHIDEVIRRIALAKPHIAFTLTHNNKLVRQYKSAVNSQQKLKRLAAICGTEFVQNALEIQWQHEGLQLSGWVATPQFHRTQNDLNYCYVNGRMVRDKVINHAIRQAYAEFLGNEYYPAFVLFIDLDPKEVDVNVHPTKHEIRFHQQRLIHDFIYQGISHALHSEQVELPLSPNHQINEPVGYWQVSNKPNRAAAGQNIFSPSYSSADPSEKKSVHHTPHFHTERSNKTEQKIYAELCSAPHSPQTVATQAFETANITTTPYLQALALVENKALLLQQNSLFYLLSITQLQQLKYQLLLQKSPTRQPLLIPLLLHLSAQQFTQWQQQHTFFEKIGVHIEANAEQKTITIMEVAICLRQQNLQHCVIHLLSQSIETLEQFIQTLCEQISHEPLSTYANS